MSKYLIKVYCSDADLMSEDEIYRAFKSMKSALFIKGVTMSLIAVHTLNEVEALELETCAERMPDGEPDPA